MAAINSIATGAVSVGVAVGAGVTESNKSAAAQKSGGISTGAGAQDATSGSSDTIQLSTRAQKIQKLQEDFFPSGYRSIQITPDFIERLQEYGFISAADATRLGSIAGASTGLPAVDSSSPDATEKLTGAIESMINRLGDKKPDNSLIGTLNKADAVLTELDGPLSAATKGGIKEVIKELADYTRADDQLSLTKADANTLQQLKLVMHFAEGMGQENNPSEKINSYLSILKQSL